MNNFFKEPLPLFYSGVLYYHLPIILRYLEQQSPLVLIVDNKDFFAEILKKSFFFTKVEIFPTISFNYDSYSSSFDELDFLYKNYHAKSGIFLCTPGDLLRKLPPKEFFERNTLTISLFDERQTILRLLESLNYTENVHLVERSYVQKGHIIDIFLQEPFRLFFEENLLIKIQKLDPISLMPIPSFLENLTFINNSSLNFEFLREKIQDNSLKNLFFKSIKGESFCNLNAFLSHCFPVHNNLIELLNALPIFFNTKQEDQEESDFFFAKKELNAIHLSSFDKGESLPFKKVSLKGTSLDTLTQNYSKKIFIGSKKLENFETINGFIEKSFSIKNSIYIAEQDVYPKISNKNFLFSLSLSDLKIGDLIVHQFLGIGKYLGITTLEHDEQHNDYILLEYLNSEKVYIPIYKIYLLSKYSGSHNIDSLRSKKFEQVKNKAQESIKKLAINLLNLQAERLSEERSPYIIDKSLKDFEIQFLENFPFDLTLDQEKVYKEIIQDLESSKIMDRLVCGDVGVGKTEIAARAACRVALSGYQVVLLCPTTILSYQHYLSFKERFSDIPITIDYLNRFKSTKSQKDLLNKTKEGSIDILITTTKFLGKKNIFKKLGLVIIDEEHKFGVQDKESIKKEYHLIDILSLSATPIPRTLQLSLFNLKDLSIIHTKPKNRIPTEIFIQKEDLNLVKELILKEVERNGQVFIVHYKIDSLYALQDKLKHLLPNITFSVTHGQMPIKELEQTFLDFYNKKINVLLTTILIESGIDLPNVNTLIVFSSDRFGLAQLHQLKGRIGRGNATSCAYFLIPNKELRTITKERLLALEKSPTGFSVALEDLDLRGPGDLLGPEQSGHLFHIGIEFYLQMLQEAIQELKGESKTYEIEIQSQEHYSIPEGFMPSEKERLFFYKQISSITSLEDLDQLKDQTVRNYGNLPLSLEHLFFLMEYKVILLNTPIQKIIIKKETGILIFKDLEEQELYKLLNFSKNNIFFTLKAPNQLSFSVTKDTKERLISLNKVFLSSI